MAEAVFTYAEARARAEKTGVFQVNPDRPQLCFAWRVTYTRDKGGYCQDGSRFFGYRAEAQQAADQAMRDDNRDDARFMGELVAEVHLVTTSLNCILADEWHRTVEVWGVLAKMNPDHFHYSFGRFEPLTPWAAGRHERLTELRQEAQRALPDYPLTAVSTVMQRAFEQRQNIPTRRIAA